MSVFPAPAVPIAAPLTRQVAAGTLALAVGIGVGRFVFTPILPPMMAELPLSRTAAGAIASANFAGYLAGAVLAASVRLPGSPRAWLLGSLAASAVSTAAMGLIRNVPGFLALRFAGGIASALVLILASAIVLEGLAGVGRRDLSSRVFGGVGLGIAASALLVAVLRNQGAAWTTLWLGSGALAAVLAGAVASLLAPVAHPAAMGPARPPAARLVGPGLAGLVSAYGLFGFGYVVTATFLVAIVRADPTMRPLEPIAWVLFGIAAVPSVALWNRLARRVGIPRAFAAAALTEAMGVIASVVWRGPAGVVLAGVLVGGTFMGLTALGLMRAVELAPDAPRPMIAMMTAAFGIGQCVGPLLAGEISDWTGSFRDASLLAALALGAAAVLAMRGAIGGTPS